MTDVSPIRREKKSLYELDARTRRRNAAEKRFRAYGVIAIATGLFFLVVLLASIIWNGIPAFTQTYITVQVELIEEKLDKSGTRDLAVMKKVTTFGYAPLIDAGIAAALDDNGIDRVCLYYFGIARHGGRGIDGLPVPTTDQIEARDNIDCVVAISANLLYGAFGDQHEYQWLRQLTPAEKIGYSIYVYDLRKGRSPP